NPLPVWESADGDHICVGSVDELAELSGKKLTKIIFVRHGESEKNIDDIFTSAVDKYPLTKAGEQQAQEVAGKITDKIDLIISSPVLRTRQTAEIINKKLKAEIIFDDLIGEYFYGSWEDKKRVDLKKQADYQEYQKISASLEAKYNFRFAGDGESRAQITERVRKFLEKVSREHAGKTILVVSHGGINASMSKIIRGIDFDAFFAEERIGYRGVQYFYLDENGREYNLHKQFVDKIEIVKDGKKYKRVPEVLDCWFESGSMPYGQMHYPFENREKFEAGFPAQFIAEGQDQTRGWFYTLHVLATALTTGKNPSIPKKQTCPAFNNVIVNGIVLAEDGKKMSKRLKNYPEPDLMIAKYGADAMRYYLVTAPVMEAQALNFSEVGVREMYNKLVNTVWNVVEFYKMYSDCHPRENGDPDTRRLDSRFHGNDSSNVLDKWILAKLNLLVKDVTEGMENYELVKASRPIVEFVTELSQWYVRRSRDRFKDGNSTVILSEAKDLKDYSATPQNDKQQAIATLHEVLLTLSKVMAPFTPFMAEKVYQGVRNKEKGTNESVHLEMWPQYDEKMIDEKVLLGMDFARKIVELGLSIRAFKGIKVKQPLSLLVVDCISEMAKNNFGEERLVDEMKRIIADELNVKEVKVIWKSELGKNVYNVIWNETPNSDLQVGLDTTITPALKAEGTAREIVRAINQLRKEMKLTISDSVVVSYETDDSELKKVIAEFGDEIKKSTLTKKLTAENIFDAKEIEIDEKKLKLFINLSSLRQAQGRL
ncbi:MAG: class I tRNA ligase family protein, partial [Candidatus Magasanikbacteria bacterium]